MSRRVCPDCGGAEFEVDGIEHHTWRVDGDGEFLEDRGCYEANMAEGTEWNCVECGAVFPDNTTLVEDRA